MYRIRAIVALMALVSAVAAHAGIPLAPPPSPPPETATMPAPPLPQWGPETPLPRVTTQWLPPLMPLSPQTTLRERAEELSNVTVEPENPVYSIVQSEIVVEGTNAFHLAHPGFTDHLITLDTPVLVESGTHVYFKSRLGWATATQEARFQVSSDNGQSWDTLWSRAGDQTAGDTYFHKIAIDLSPYAGDTLHLRFHYALTGSAYTDVEPHVGWLIDDIQVGPAFITRPYTGVGEPSAAEVLAVEYINRARADAMAEATRLRNDDDPHVLNAVNYFNVNLDEMEAQFATLEQTVPPIAINERLMAAARLHSQDMFDNVFQSHTSSNNPPIPHQPDDGPGARAHYQDYQWSTIAENVFAYGQSVWHSHAGYNIDWGPGTWHGMQDPPGHRLAIHNPTYREVGVGIIEDENSDNGGSVGPVISTQKFGVDLHRDQPFLVGVAYEEHGQLFYHAAYALGGVQVHVAGSGFHAMSSTYGAYAVPLPGDGTYTVTFQAPGYMAYSTDFTVSDGRNVKIDYVAVLDAGAIWIETIERMPGGDIRFEVDYAGNIADLQVRVSSDLENWSDYPTIWTHVGGTLYRADGAPVAGDEVFFKVVGDP